MNILWKLAAVAITFLAFAPPAIGESTAPAGPDDPYDADDPRCVIVTRVLNVSATGEVDLGIAVDADAVISVTTIACLRTDGGVLVFKKGFPVLVFTDIGTTTHTLGDATTSIGGSHSVQVGAGANVFIGGVSGTVGGGHDHDTDVRHGDIVDEPIVDFETRRVHAPGSYPIDWCSGGDQKVCKPPDEEVLTALDERNLRVLIIATLIENNDPLITDYLDDKPGAEDDLREKLKDVDTMLEVIGEELLETIPGVNIGGQGPSGR